LVYPALVAIYQGGWPAELFQGTQLLLKNPYCVVEGREAFEPIVEATAPGETSQYNFRYS